MALVHTTAIVLHTFPYGDSSKIVRLATPDHGIVSAVAKGAHRARSKFGARLQPLSEGEATVYVKQSRDLQTLSEFEVTQSRGELAQDVLRFAAASAVAELVLRCSPDGPSGHLFGILQSGLDWLLESPDEDVSKVALAAIWGTVAGLGFTPALEVCAVDGTALSETDTAFSVPDGGLLCATCASSRKTARLPVADRVALREFVVGHIPEGPLEDRHAAAHRRLASRFVHRHVAEDRELKAVRFWEELGT